MGILIGKMMIHQWMEKGNGIIMGHLTNQTLLLG